MSRGILADFLTSTKQKYLSSLRSSSLKEWTVVMGNESGDLDTIACGIAYAYHRTHHHNKPTIPLIRIHKNDLRLRAENVYALSLAGINEPETQLFLISDIPNFGEWARQQREFALVDHNRLAPEFQSGDDAEGQKNVVAIVDHHQDEGLHKETAKPRIISPTGSCASLITTHILNEDTTKSSIPPEVSTLLLSAILVDTNLKSISDGGKGTELDFSAAAALAPNAIFPDGVSRDDIEALTTSLSEVQPAPSSLAEMTVSQSPSPSQHLESTIQTLRSSAPITTLSETLISKKFDVSHLSVSELLKRDYKEYDLEVPHESGKTKIKAGLSTVPVSLTDWAGSGEGSIDHLLAEGSSFMSERGLTVLGVLTTFRKVSKKKPKGKGAREMAWLVRTDLHTSSLPDSIASQIFSGFEGSEEIVAKRHKKFTNYTAPKSKNSDKDSHARHQNIIVRVYKQGNANATRKASAPILRRVLEEPELKL